jgi:hypothetical protein
MSPSVASSFIKISLKVKILTHKSDALTKNTMSKRGERSKLLQHDELDIETNAYGTTDKRYDIIYVAHHATQHVLTCMH